MSRISNTVSTQTYIILAKKFGYISYYFNSVLPCVSDVDLPEAERVSVITPLPHLFQFKNCLVTTFIFFSS
jgi:hypothetical protein